MHPPADVYIITEQVLQTSNEGATVQHRVSWNTLQTHQPRHRALVVGVRADMDDNRITS